MEDAGGASTWGGRGPQGAGDTGMGLVGSHKERRAERGLGGRRANETQRQRSRERQREPVTERWREAAGENKRQTDRQQIHRDTERKTKRPFSGVRTKPDRKETMGQLSRRGCDTGRETSSAWPGVERGTEKHGRGNRGVT